MRTVEYVKQDGTNPFQQWLNKLDRTVIAKVQVARARLESGNTSNIKWFSGIGEYRINWGPGYRLYLAQDGDELIVLFGGGTKKTQKSDYSKSYKAETGIQSS